MKITRFDPSIHSPAADLDLTDKVYLITGAAGAIGRSLAMATGKLGATIILVDANRKGLDEIYDQLEAAGCPTPASLVLDTATAGIEQYEELADVIEKEFGRLDGIVHCVAEAGILTPMERYPLDTWSRVMLVNLNGPYMLTRACMELLKKAQDAPVIFTTSDVARAGRAYWGAYAVSGHAIEGLVEVWADELENNTPVRMNTIDPGPVRSAFRAKLYPGEVPTEQPTADVVVPAYLYLLTQSVTGTALKAQGT